MTRTLSIAPPPYVRPALSRSESSPVMAAQSRAVAVVPGTFEVDLRSDVCPEASACWSMARRLVYLDGDHLTASFSESLATPLAREIDRIAPRPKP